MRCGSRGRASVTLSRSPSRSIRSAPIAQRSLQTPGFPYGFRAVGLTRASYRPLDTSGSRSVQAATGRSPLQLQLPAAQCRRRVHSRANGRIVFQRGAAYDGGSSSLYLINQNGTGLVRLTRGTARRAALLVAEQPADRVRVDDAATRTSTSSGRTARRLKELTFSQGFDGDPSWNDDGSRLAFETTRNGAFDIYGASTPTAPHRCG